MYVTRRSLGSFADPRNTLVHPLERIYKRPVDEITGLSGPDEEFAIHFYD